MPSGLQFPRATEPLFVADFSRRHASYNRKVLLVLSLAIALLALSVGYMEQLELSAGLQAATQLLAGLGLLVALLGVPARLKAHHGILMVVYVGLLQMLFIAWCLSPSLRAGLPWLTLPLLLPGLILRLRFVYVLPTALFLWMLQFGALNFMEPPNFMMFLQWLAFTSLLFATVLIYSYALEQECRRAFGFLLQQPGLHHRRHAPERVDGA